jgi:hypothetical protein
MKLFYDGFHISFMQSLLVAEESSKSPGPLFLHA